MKKTQPMNSFQAIFLACLFFFYACGDSKDSPKQQVPFTFYLLPLTLYLLPSLPESFSAANSMAISKADLVNSRTR